MTIPHVRKLSSCEWSKLEEFPDKIVPPADRAIAFVAESDSQRPVGRIFVLSLVHLEGIYVDPAQRGSGLMNRLVQKAEQEIQNLGASVSFAYGSNPTMEDYISRLAYLKQPWSVWRKELAPCQ
jgi:GNAT superfamily N-acetyltransferase